MRAPMKTDAASAGVLDTPFGKFARLQILTIEVLFAGKKPAMPPEDPAGAGTRILASPRGVEPLFSP